MMKSELIKRMAHKQFQLADRDVELAVKTMLEHMSENLAGGRRIEPRASRASRCISARRGSPATQGPGRRSRVRRGMACTSSRARNCASASTERLAIESLREALRNRLMFRPAENGQRAPVRGSADGSGPPMSAARRVLADVFGFESFRPGQEAVIERCWGCATC